MIINNLDQEQTPTKKDVEAMGSVLKTIGGYFHVFIFLFDDFSLMKVLMLKFTKT